jgi:hypothetical protein
MPAQAEFRCQILEAREVAQFPKQNLDAIRRAGYEKVDAFGAQENRAFERLLPAKSDEALAKWLQIAQLGKAISCDICDLL